MPLPGATYPPERPPVRPGGLFRLAPRAGPR
jgi:hypothetical protein